MQTLLWLSLIAKRHTIDGIYELTMQEYQDRQLCKNRVRAFRVLSLSSSPRQTRLSSTLLYNFKALALQLRRFKFAFCCHQICYVKGANQFVLLLVPDVAVTA